MRTSRVRAVSFGALGLSAGGLIGASAAMSTLMTWECPIRSMLGVQCPGCGSTRCVQAIVRGDVFGALHHNALTTVTILLTCAFAGVGAVAPSALMAGYQRAFPLARRTVLAAVFVVVVFTLVRNIV